MARLFLCGLLAVASAGCAGQGYLADRGRDALDVFTLTIGMGGGAGARIGPLHAGLYAYSDWVGLRGGRLEFSGLFHSGSYDTTAYSEEYFRYHELPEADRVKSYEAVGYPFVSFAQLDKPLGEEARWQPTGLLPYYTQIEVVAGALGGLRLGFNPGELVDFLLGWATLDIYNDDLGARQQEGNHR
jgi:hypothetical protein